MKDIGHIICFGYLDLHVLMSYNYTVAQIV